MVDLFSEVEEELRSDRYLNLFRAAAPWATAILALVLLSYLGYWGYKAYQDRNLAAAALSYQKGVDAVGQNDAAAAFTDFQAAAKAGAPGYKTLALMQEGDLRLAAGKSDQAAGLYDSAAAAAPNQIFGDLARLKAAEALLGAAPMAQLRTRLTPLTAAKRPFAIYAREALAMGELMAGDTAAAKRDFTLVSFSLDAPQDMRERSQIALDLIDAGETASAAAAVKAAATLPPTAALNLPPPSAPKAGNAGNAVPTPPAGAAK